MATTTLFSIRGLLAMVAVVAGMCAALHYASPATLLIAQACMLVVLIGFAVGATTGPARMRRFCIAALAAGLIHLFVCSVQRGMLDVGMGSLSEYDPIDPAPSSSPTVCCCKRLWDSIKIQSPTLNSSSIAAPLEYKPDLTSFVQIGVLDATLLIGIVAGCAAVMLDQWRRRGARGRTSNNRSAVGASGGATT